MATGKGYTPSEIQSMQQDALRRVREMQQRSLNYVNAQNNPVQTQQPQAQQNTRQQTVPPQQHTQTSSPPRNNNNNNNQGNFRQNPTQTASSAQHTQTYQRQNTQQAFSNQTAQNRHSYETEKPPRQNAQNNRFYQNANAREQPPPFNQPPPTPPPMQNENKPPPQKHGFEALGNLLSDIKIDEEKALIIFILIILARNGADIKLLAALGYLLM